MNKRWTAITFLGFGLLMSLAARAQDLPQEKPWMNKQTVAQLSLIGVGYALDGYSTTAGRWRWKGDEVNPLVDPGSKGKTALYFAGTFAGTVGGSYLLRRHPRARWITTGVVTGLELYLAGRNFHLARIAEQRCIGNPVCTLR